MAGGGTTDLASHCAILQSPPSNDVSAKADGIRFKEEAGATEWSGAVGREERTSLEAKRAEPCRARRRALLARPSSETGLNALGLLDGPFVQ